MPGRSWHREQTNELSFNYRGEFQVFERFVAAVITTVIVGSSLQAQVTVFTTRAEWETAVNNRFELEDFNSLPTGFFIEGNNTAGSLTFNGANVLAGTSGVLSGSNPRNIDATNFTRLVVDGSPVRTFEMIFPENVYAWAMEFNEEVVGDNTHISFGDDVNAVDLTTFVGGAHSGFVGFVADHRFDRVVFSDPFISFVDVGIDNVAFAKAAAQSAVRLDIDVFNAPADDTQLAFERMSEPGIIGNLNGTFFPTATVDGVTVTATTISGSSVGFRDRGDDPNNLPPYSNLVKEFLFAEGTDGSTIEVTLEGLPAGDYLVNSFHFDRLAADGNGRFDIFVDDAIGNNQLKIDDATYDLVNPTYLGEAYQLASDGVNDVKVRVVEDSDTNRTRFNGIQIIPLTGSFAPAGVNFAETQLDFLNPGSTLFYEIHFDGVSELTLDTLGTPNATDTEIALFDSNGMLLGENDDIDPPNRHSELVFDDLCGGIYYLAIGGFDTNFSDGFNVDQFSQSFLPGLVTVNVSTGDTPQTFGSVDVVGVPFSDSVEQSIESGTFKFIELSYDGGQEGSQLIIDTVGSDFDTEIGLYDANGDLIDNDDQGGGNDQARLTLNDLPAGDYFLVLAGWDTQFSDNFGVTTASQFESGMGVVNVSTEFVPPQNDDFESTTNILDPDFSVTGNNFNATTQADEQQLENTGSTVWWFFDADEDGIVTIDTFGSDFDTQLHIFTDFELGFPNLTPVADNNDADGLQSEVSFEVIAGKCYEIRVGGFRPTGQTGPGAEGNIVLNGSFALPLLGDINCDGVVNLLDVGPFIEAIGNGVLDPKADLNEDGADNLLDVAPFIDILGGG